MRIITNVIIGLLILLSLSIFLTPTSAISAGNANVGTTLVISDIPVGSDVFFILNNGVPEFARADSNGTVRYLPLVQGTLRVNVVQNRNLTDSLTIDIGPAITQTPPPSPGGGTGSGSSTGGNGVITKEPLSNIAKSETQENNLIAGRAVTYTFSNPGIPIYQLVVTGEENENLVAIRVELLNGTSKLAGESAPGNVYANINIWSGSNNIDNILTKFRIENSWIGDNNIAKSDINLVRWNQNKWVSLETKEIDEDDIYTYFEANTTGLFETNVTGLSTFALSSVKSTTPISTTLPGVTGTTPNPVETTIQNIEIPKTTTKTSGFETVLAIIGISIIYIVRKVR